MTPAVDMVEALDEARARVLAQDNDAHLVWVDLSQGARDFYIARARKIREADERAGLLTVPREPTQAMAEAYERHCGWVLGLHSWDAAVSASPFASAAQGEGGE